jgi:NADH/NAD ratio-sensing transcriptional regulator Rex
MDILERISQVRKEDYEFTGNVEDAVFVFKGVLGETLVKQANFAGDAVKIVAAFTEKPVQSNFYEVFELEKMSNLIPRLAVKTAILCVPHKEAAYVAEQLIKCELYQPERMTCAGERRSSL